MGWIIPPGKKCGLLERKTPFGKVCRPFGEMAEADRIKIIPQEEWDDYIGTISLRPYVKHIFDQDGVGSCFPSGTLVRMKDGSEKPINDIRVLDEVVTAEGRVSRVMQTMVRDHHGKMCRLLLSGSHHLRCTPEHPVLTKRGYIQAGKLRRNDMVAFPRYAAETTRVIQTAEFCYERQFTGSQRVVRAKAGSSSVRKIPGREAATLTIHPLPDLIELTPGFGRLIGLFLAEGCTSYGKVTYTFAAHEQDTLADEVIRLFHSELGVDARLQIRGNSSVKVNVHGVHWARLFEGLCGKLSGGKRMHPSITSGPLEFLESVLSGWCDGDGIGPCKNGGRTISHSLALGMFDIANALGKQPAIRVGRQPKLTHGVKSRQPVWDVEWGNGQVSQYWKADYRKQQDDTHLWRRVELVEEDDFDGPVFNLEVEEDHSYVAEGIGVHNCATESTTQAIQVVREIEGKPFNLLNPWYIYHTTSGGRDNGSSIDENLEFILENGVAPEDVWPRSKGWKASPSAEAREAALNYKGLEWFDIDNIDEFGTALFLGYPVVFGYSGHSVLATEVISASELEYANSWDPTWGDAGFGRLRFSQVYWRYGAWALRSTTQAIPPALKLVP